MSDVPAEVLSGLVELGVSHGVVVRPGDTLVVTVRDDVSAELVQRFRSSWEEFLPGVRVVVVVGTGLAVYREGVDGVSGGDVEFSGGVLSSPEYAGAFRKVMSGTDLALLTDGEREVLRAARVEAGVDGPGYPPPVSGARAS